MLEVLVPVIVAAALIILWYTRRRPKAAPTPPLWRYRVAKFKSGHNKWPNPVEGRHKLFPHPAEWVLLAPDQESPIGFRMLEPAELDPCASCEKPIQVAGDGACCAKCGAHIHMSPRCAGVANSFGIPSCSDCFADVSAVEVGELRFYPEED